MKTTLFFYLFYIFIVKLVTGATLSGSSPYSVLDQTFQFTCTQTGSITSTTLSFKRSNSSICTIANPGNASQCKQFISIPRYSCYCGGSGVFYLNISSVSLQDEDRWRCDVSQSQSSNNITLPVYYGPYNNVTFNKNSPVTVIEDVTVSLTARCSAHCKPDCSYTWWRGSQQVSDNRDLSLGSFRRGQEGDYTCRAENTVTGVTADSQVLTVNVHWYPAQPTHNCPPQIVLGQTGSCTCQTSDRGNPAGTVQWRSPNNQQISSSSTSSSVQLNLASIPRSDNGRSYICRAVNSLSNSKKDTTYTVNVAFGPPGVSITGNQQTDAPDVLTLTCTTTGPVNPAPTLTWRNSTDGAVLSGTSPVRVGSSQDGGYVYRSTLSITTQWYQDGDTIVCEGRNPRIQSQQTVTDSEQLDINYPPQSAPVISGLSSSPVYEGDSVSVTCRVTGGKPLVTTVTLTCPGGHQSSSTTTDGSDIRLTTLTFNVTRDLRSQPCQCSAVHSTGRYQLSANRTKNNVYYPPSIRNLSQSQSFPWLEGRTESLTCDLSDPGHPSATYIWYRDDVRQTQQTGQRWQFSPLSYTDNRRQIYCQAENQFTVHKSRVVKSSVLTLDVYYSPRVSTTPSSSVTKIEGDSLTVDCTADSNPTPTGYHWTHQSVTRSSEHQLSIPDLDRTDHGEYTCTATTQAGSYGSLSGTATVQIVVNYSPDLTVTNVTETETQTATVKCLADGRPENFNFFPFLHTWRGQVIRHVTGQKTGREYQKAFSSSSFQDSGVYVCEVENGVPDRQGVRLHKANISVQINATPKLTVGMESETVVGAELRENITLYRTIFSHTRITNHTWTKAGQTLTTSQVSDTPVELDIYGVRVEEMGLNFTLNVGQFNNSHDVGEYLLQVCNTVGCLTSVINLTAAGPPAPPTQFRIFNTTQTSVLLSWRAGFPGGPYTQVFVVEYRTPGGDWKEFTDSVSGIEGQLMVVEVTGLSAGTLYEFRVFARNTREVRNKSDYTDVLQEITKVIPPSSVNGALIGGVVGSVVAVLVVVAVIIVIIKRRSSKEGDSSKIDLHERNKREENSDIMVDNMLYETSENARGRKKPVMEDNVLYSTSGDMAAAGGAEYAVVKKKPAGKNQKADKKKDKTKGTKADKKPLRKQNRGDVYENTQPGLYGAKADENTYANAAFVSDETQQDETQESNAEDPGHYRDADGLLYSKIDFSNQKPSEVVHREEEPTEYAGIAFGKVGPPLPPDEEDEKQQKS